MIETTQKGGGASLSPNMTFYEHQILSPRLTGDRLDIKLWPLIAIEHSDVILTLYVVVPIRRKFHPGIVKLALRLCSSPSVLLPTAHRTLSYSWMRRRQRFR